MQKLLIIGSVFPEPNSSAAGTRMMQLIHFFLKKHWEITFASSATLSGNEVELNELGVHSLQIQINDSSFDIILQELDPKMVIFDRFYIEEQFSWRVAANCPQALRVLDTEDLHFLRQARHQALKDDRAFEETDLFSKMAERELASILRSDLSLIISTHELNLLETTFKVPSEILYYLPILVAEEQMNQFPKRLAFSERKDFVFIGNFMHAPNWDAVLHLKNKVWSNIKKMLPQAQLKIYGAYPSQKAFDLHDEKQGFLVLGRTENALLSLENARICLAPIRFGAGIKGKLLEAMITGTPSVTTSIGSEAMTHEGNWAGYITDDYDQFAQGAVELYLQEKSWIEAQQRGFEIVKSKFKSSLFEEPFMERIEILLLNLTRHRQENFISSILMQHRQLSTKYLSKWIEQKNKKY